MNTKRPYFIFDIDDVLANCSEAVREMYNLEHGTNIGPATSYNTIAAWPDIGEEGAAWFYNTYTSDEPMGSLPVIEGAVEMANEIRKHFRIAYCTHRPSKIERITRLWLERNGFPKGECFFNSGCKVAMRKNTTGPMIFIDDNAEYLTQIAAASEYPTLILCVTMPHNAQMSLPKEAIRITDYKMIPVISVAWKEQIVGFSS